MGSIDQQAVKNRLLSSLSGVDFAAISPNASLRSLRPGEVLLGSREPIREIFFPDAGMISLVSTVGDEIEIGVVGREGLIGVPAILGVAGAPLRAVCQIPCEGTSISVASLISAMGRSATLTQMMLRYVHAFSIQLVSTIYANGNFTVDQRLARWILMCGDRIEGDDIAVTHEFLAMMLGVRRPGVTVATHVLEGHHMIRATRGNIKILDRDRLRGLAGGSYGLAEAEYERVMSVPAAERRPSAKPVHAHLAAVA